MNVHIREHVKSDGADESGDSVVPRERATSPPRLFRIPTPMVSFRWLLQWPDHGTNC